MRFSGFRDFFSDNPSGVLSVMSTPERERIIISLLEKWKEEQDSKRQ